MVVVDNHYLIEPNHYQEVPFNCSYKLNPEVREFVFFEFGLKSLPPFLFFILGTMRYFNIKDIARGHARYSNFFKTKVLISFLMGLFDLAQAIVILVIPNGAPHTGWVNVCGFDYLALFYVFQCIAWFYGTWLMAFEYRRLLSEAWYANQMFWVLNLVFETIAFVV